MRLGVFGGTFDPVHLGHLRPLDEVVPQLKIDRVDYVPARRSPWKTDQILADERHRVAMLALALAGYAERTISLAELLRPEPSYTIDTLRSLRAEHPNCDLFFFLGTDALAGFARWREPEAILALATVVAFRREPIGTREALDALPPPWRERVMVFETKPVTISSTDLRADIREGRSVEGKVPEAVQEYITKERLYLRGAATA
jgi:nicotinate-nucleotide adenylyltransferase